MPIAVALSPRAMTALGAMALTTLCFQTFDSSATPSQSDAMTLARLNIVDQQMATLRATMNHVLKETNTTIPSNLKWPAQPTASDDAPFSQIVKMLFFIVAMIGWANSLVALYSEAGAAADKMMAAGLWGACAAFVSLWFLGEPKEWYGYLLGATWGFYAAIFLWRTFAEQESHVEVDGLKA